MNEESINNPSNSVEKESANVSLTEESSVNKRENTRSRIAQIYVYAFFGTIAATFIIGLIKSFGLKEYIDFLIAVSGVLSGPLGFIIGYYFKAASDNK
jgi:hypothetical protein